MNKRAAMLGVYLISWAMVSGCGPSVPSCPEGARYFASVGACLRPCVSTSEIQCEEDGGVREAGAPDASDAATDAAMDASDSEAATPDVTEAATPDAMEAGTELAAPRLLGPLSTSRVTSRRPTLRWELPMGVTDARIELCRDRACTRVIETVDGSTSARPVSDLPTGWVFWRARGRSGATVGRATSATWQLWVGARSAPVDTSWGSTFDVNGDGYGDVAAYATGPREIRVFLGSASGLSATPQRVIGTDSPAVDMAAADVNGDGFADLVAVTRPPNAGEGSGLGGLQWLAGSSSGATMTWNVTVRGTSADEFVVPTLTDVGDDDQDGFADVLLGRSTKTIGGREGIGDVLLLHGSVGGLVAPTSAWLVGADAPGIGQPLVAIGDVDGDGRTDVAIGSRSSLGLHRSTPTGLSRMASATYAQDSLTAIGDADGDGLADVLEVSGMMATVLRGSAAGLTASTISAPAPFGVTTAAGASVGDVNADGADDLVVAWTDPMAGKRLDLVHGGASRYSTFVRRWSGALLGSGVDLYSVAASDINGDGRPDLVIATSARNAGTTMRAGVLAVFENAATGFSEAPSIEIAGAADEALGSVLLM